MCQKKPGLRCEKSARERLETAKERYQELKSNPHSRDFCIAKQQLHLASTDVAMHGEESESLEQVKDVRKRSAKRVEEFLEEFSGKKIPLPLSEVERKAHKENIDYLTYQITLRAKHDSEVSDSLCKSLAYSQHVLKASEGEGGEGSVRYNESDFEIEEGNTKTSMWAKDIETVEFWLSREGKTVAFAKIQKEPGSVTLCDVEVAPDALGNGYAEALMGLISKKEDQPIYTTGSFTPEGFATLGHKIPVDPATNETSDVHFRSMNFVDDWENRRPKFPL